VVLSIMGFLAIVNAYTMRICLNVAITEMTIKKIRNETDNGVCPADGNSGGSGLGKGTFEWDEQLQGIILGAFFWVKIENFVI
jgi:MFS transporter, ACS family, solute carrier family 17 (sodium-dependent inorganic phosphate cotransporter), other